jgi:hypothetical protein
LKNELSKKTAISRQFLLGLTFNPGDGGHTFLQNVGESTVLHSVTSQMIVLFIVTAVRTSNPISWVSFPVSHATPGSVTQ